MALLTRDLIERIYIPQNLPDPKSPKSPPPPSRRNSRIPSADAGIGSLQLQRSYIEIRTCTSEAVAILFNISEPDLISMVFRDSV